MEATPEREGSFFKDPFERCYNLVLRKKKIMNSRKVKMISTSSNNNTLVERFMKAFLNGLHKGTVNFLLHSPSIDMQRQINLSIRGVAFFCAVGLYLNSV